MNPFRDAQISEQMINDDASDLKNDKKRMTKQMIVKTIERMIKQMNDPNYIQLKHKYPEKYKNQMKQLFSEFEERYPSLFKMVLLKGVEIDWNQLNMMLGLMQDIVDDKVSRFEASSQVGQQLFYQHIPEDILRVESQK